jgi:predicted nucleic acid-binding protein
MKVLFDTNIIMDYFFEREPFVNEADLIFDAKEKGLFEAYISAITPLNLVYSGKKYASAKKLHQILISLLASFEICGIDSKILQRASISSIKDYEDAVQYESAIATGIEVIVTRDLKDFTGTDIPVLSPADFLKTLPASNNTPWILFKTSFRTELTRLRGFVAVTKREMQALFATLFVWFVVVVAI